MKADQFLRAMGMVDENLLDLNEPDVPAEPALPAHEPPVPSAEPAPPVRRPSVLLRWILAGGCAAACIAGAVLLLRMIPRDDFIFTAPSGQDIEITRELSAAEQTADAAPQTTEPPQTDETVTRTEPRQTESDRTEPAEIVTGTQPAQTTAEQGASRKTSSVTTAKTTERQASSQTAETVQTAHAPASEQEIQHMLRTAKERAVSCDNSDYHFIPLRPYVTEDGSYYTGYYEAMQFRGIAVTAENGLADVRKYTNNAEYLKDRVQEIIRQNEARSAQISLSESCKAASGEIILCNFEESLLRALASDGNITVVGTVQFNCRIRDACAPTGNMNLMVKPAEGAAVPAEGTAGEYTFALKKNQFLWYGDYAALYYTVTPPLLDEDASVTMQNYAKFCELLEQRDDVESAWFDYAWFNRKENYQYTLGVLAFDDSLMLDGKPVTLRSEEVYDECLQSSLKAYGGAVYALGTDVSAYQKGDINMDGKVDMQDARLMQYHHMVVRENSELEYLTDAQLWLGDVSSRIESLDFSAVGLYDARTVWMYVFFNAFRKQPITMEQAAYYIEHPDEAGITEEENEQFMKQFGK